MKNQAHRRVIVIMAGGSGTRLWPLSRKKQPKQFHAFLSKKTLLEETYERAKRIVPEEAVFISTNSAYVEKIRSILPKFQKERLILEPIARGTAPAIGLVSLIVENRFPGSIIATIASDHAIENEDAFISAIKTAFSAVEKNPEKLAVIGINPTTPDTGLGYIRMGKRLSESDKEDVFFVDEFKEKPDRTTAETYLSDWRYLWNAGYFIFSAKTMLGFMDEYSPTISDILKKAEPGEGQASPSQKTLAVLYEEMKNEAIEPIIIEKLPVTSRLVIPAPIRWSDIGSWGSLYDFFKARHKTESVLFGDCIEHAGKGNLIYGLEGRTVTTFGVKNLIIVDTDDTILIADRNRSGDIKELIDVLKERGKDSLL